MAPSKKIILMSDYEIEDLIKFCFDLFGQPPKQIFGFTYLLKQKFGYITDEKIKEGVTNYVSGNFYERSTRFTPSVLSHIINLRNKNQQAEYKTYETSEADKAYYKQKFIEAVRLDFDDYCNNIPPSRIYVWRFLCKQLMDKGLLYEEEYEQASKKELHQAVSFQSEFKPLCMKVFNDLAMNEKHISNFII